MLSKALFTSKTDMWSTPQDFFDKLNEEFHFTLDACAISFNAKCENFYTPEDDGLIQPWYGTVWCNPPSGKEIGKWVKRGYEANCTVVMLLPARTDTAWFHDWVYGKAELRFVRGRLKFGGGSGCAPFPSVIAIYRKREDG